MPRVLARAPGGQTRPAAPPSAPGAGAIAAGQAGHHDFMRASAGIVRAGRRLARAAADALSLGGLVVLVGGIALALVAGVLVANQERRESKARVQAQLRRAAQLLPVRLQRAEIILRAAPGFATAPGKLTAERWRRTVSRLGVAELAPAVRSVMLVVPDAGGRSGGGAGAAGRRGGRRAPAPDRAALVEQRVRRRSE
jgi:hypothetical protein